MDGTVCVRKTLLESRLPIYVFYNFQIKENNTIYSKNIPTPEFTDNNLLKVGTFDWNLDSTKIRKINSRSKSLNTPKDLPNNTNTVDVEMKNATVTYDDLYDRSIETLDKITVHHSSISISNSDPISLPFPVLGAGVIKSKKNHDEDTLLLLLKNCDLLLIRFEKGPDLETITPYIVDKLPIMGLNKLNGNREVYRLDHIANHDKLFLTNSSGLALVYNVIYDHNNVPSLKHSHNFKSNEIVEQCILSDMDTGDAFVSLHLDYGILTLHCIYNLQTFSQSKIYFKNSFEIPLHMIPLKKSKSILFLQESGYTIKSLSFCIEGEELEHVAEKYNTSSNSFIANSYYIPSKIIDAFGHNDSYDNETYTHDQVLVSGTDFYVYVIDVFYHKKLHTFKTKMTKLFKIKSALSFFCFESLNNRGEYLLDFSNEMGLIERKKTKIILEAETPVLNVVEEYWSEINPYPVFDFEVIPRLDKYSIESYSNELWMLCGTGSNHSLMNVKHGCIARSAISNLSCNDVFRIHKGHSKRNYWLSGETRAFLFRIDNSSEFDTNLILEVKLSGMVVASDSTQDLSILITTDQFMIVSNDELYQCYQLPYKCVLADCMYPISILLFHDDQTSKYYVYGENELEFLDFSSNFSSVINDFSKITVLKLVNHKNELHLFIGTTDGHVHCYLHQGNVFLHRGTFRISNSEKSVSELSQYDFVPYQIYLDSDKNIFVVTSTTGEYAIINADLNSFFMSGYEIIGIEKIADMTPLEIIKVDDFVYLKGNFLWKLDYTKSLYPDIVLLEENQHLPINSACLIESTTSNFTQLLVLQNNNVVCLEVNNIPSVLIKSKNFGIPCMKLVYVTELNVFTMIKFPGLNNSLPQLLFADPKSMKVIKAATNLDTIFDRSETPFCIQEWKVYEGEKVGVLLAVGCYINEGKTGSLKILKLSKMGKDFNIKLLYTVQEPKPVSHISILNDAGKSHIIYSTGSDLISYIYSTEEKRMKERKCIFKGVELIKKFAVSWIENKRVEIFVTYQNYTSITVIFSDLSFTVERTISPGDVCSDVLPIDTATVIRNNFINESITIDTGDNQVLYDVGYMPRLGNFDSFTPWISIKERMDKIYKQFITVGINGQIDLNTLVDANTIDIYSSSSKEQSSDLPKYYKLNEYIPTSANSELLGWEMITAVDNTLIDRTKNSVMI